MLKKLLKHEFAATGRFLLPMYLILLVIALIDRMVLNLDTFHGVLSIIPGFLTAAYIVSIIAVITVTMVLLVMRFYKNLLGDEGYLMFTLPVRSDQLLTAKLISSTIWTLLSVFAVVASLLIAFATPDVMQNIARIFRDVYEELHDMFGGLAVLVLIEIMLMSLIGLITNILLIYVAIAVGQLFNGHRVLGSFLSYVGIHTITQLVLALIIIIGGQILSRPLENFESVPRIVLPAALVVITAISGVYYYTINHIFRKKLNLE